MDWTQARLRACVLTLIQALQPKDVLTLIIEVVWSEVGYLQAQDKQAEANRLAELAQALALAKERLSNG